MRADTLARTEAGAYHRIQQLLSADECVILDGGMATELQHAGSKEYRVSDADLSRVYASDDLAKGDRLIFAATGISDSTLLKGIRYEGTHAITTSILMRAKYHTVRYIKTCHDLDLKTIRLRSDGTEHAL